MYNSKKKYAYNEKLWNNTKFFREKTKINKDGGVT